MLTGSPGEVLFFISILKPSNVGVKYRIILKQIMFNKANDADVLPLIIADFDKSAGLLPGCSQRNCGQTKQSQLLILVRQNYTKVIMQVQKQLLML